MLTEIKLLHTRTHTLAGTHIHVRRHMYAHARTLAPICACMHAHASLQKHACIQTNKNTTPPVTYTASMIPKISKSDTIRMTIFCCRLVCMFCPRRVCSFDLLPLLRKIDKILKILIILKIRSTRTILPVRKPALAARPDFCSVVLVASPEEKRSAVNNNQPQKRSAVNINQL